MSFHLVNQTGAIMGRWQDYNDIQMVEAVEHVVLESFSITHPDGGTFV